MKEIMTFRALDKKEDDDTEIRCAKCRKLILDGAMAATWNGQRTYYCVDCGLADAKDKIDRSFIGAQMRVEDDLAERFKRIVKAAGTNRAKYIAMLIRQHVEQKERET